MWGRTLDQATPVVVEFSMVYSGTQEKRSGSLRIAHTAPGGMSSLVRTEAGGSFMFTAMMPPHPSYHSHHGVIFPRVRCDTSLTGCDSERYPTY